MHLVVHSMESNRIDGANEMIRLSAEFTQAQGADAIISLSLSYEI